MQRILYRFIADLACLAVRSERWKDFEILALRRQVEVLRRQVGRAKVTDDDRSILAAIAQALPKARRIGWIVTPETLLRWHRKRIARHWTQPARRPGRPRTDRQIRQLVLQMARDNATWGY